MTATSIARRIEDVTGTSFPNVNQLAKFFKKDNRKVIEFLDGLDTFEDGRQHKYFSLDVAERVIEKRTKGGFYQ